MAFPLRHAHLLWQYQHILSCTPMPMIYSSATFQQASLYQHPRSDWEATDGDAPLASQQTQTKQIVGPVQAEIKSSTVSPPRTEGY